MYLELKVQNSFHSSRSLLVHLEGTFNLLKKWDNCETVCIAGLFHSIYGTNSFKKETLLLADRDRVRTVIGNDAEELVYLFCVSTRNFLRSAIDNSDTLKNRFTGEDIKIDGALLKLLLEIEAANLLEQADFILFGRKDTIRFVNKLLEKGQDYLSPKAIEDLDKFSKSSFSLWKLITRKKAL